MEEKYIELLLKKCINIDNNKTLFINYDVINQPFIDKLVKYAKSNGVIDIYLDKKNLFEEHDLLKELTIQDIEKHNYFNDSIWDEYAKKKANFLVFRSLIPDVMDDIEPEKIAKASYVRQLTKPVYNEEKLKCRINWCFAVLPNKIWAKKVYGNNKNSYDILEKSIYSFCKVNTNNPIKSWNEQLDTNKYRISILNNLKLKSLHYKNSLGTDLSIELLEEGIWCDVSSNGLVNMPSYEIYTSPNYTKTDGIVYSSKPLNYNGAVVDEFWIRFKDGKAIEYGAKKGEEILKRIITSDSNSCYLGECALVENNSPISKSGLVFGITLIDENASCHIALGNGFAKCINNGINLTKEELLEKCLNLSKIHVDFMIGTPDLEIIGKTFDNQIVKIFKNGNFAI